MTLDPFHAREFFHLALLRHLGARLSGRAYAVKGGICLRLFHGSPRLSEDIDLDAHSGIRRGTLERATDSVLDSGALGADLLRHGIELTGITKPKQTDTTQRWKVGLRCAGASAATKIEFSRRRDAIPFTRADPHPELLDRYGLFPFGVQHYGRAEMAAQKLRALASPNRSALRDLFDLDLLFARSPEARATVARNPAGVVAAAAEKVADFTRAEFRSQVLPFLEAESRAAFEGKDSFERLRDRMLERLFGEGS